MYVSYFIFEVKFNLMTLIILNLHQTKRCKKFIQLTQSCFQITSLSFTSFDSRWNIYKVAKLASFMNLKADIRQFDLSRLNAMDRLEKCFPSVWRKWLWNSCCSHQAIRVSSILNNPSATFWNEIKPIKVSISEFVRTQLILTQGP